MTFEHDFAYFYTCFCIHCFCRYEQLFVGREGTGSPFHHAHVYNWFYQIDGTKKWWFIDPYDSVLAYPLPAFGRAAAMMFVLFPYEGNLQDFPLFKYCPLYSAELNPGDVLYNPPMWWHAIKNVSPETVAVASRWHTDGIAGHEYMMTEEDYDVDRFASMGFMFGPGSIPFPADAFPALRRACDSAREEQPLYEPTTTK